MTISLESLQPATKQELGVYFPYYQGDRRKVLPYAISLYKQANLEGTRQIEGGESVPFLATWHVSSLPADLTRCSLQFDGNADLRYELVLPNYEFIGFLIEVVVQLKRYQVADFSAAFYRKLMRYED